MIRSTTLEIPFQTRFSNGSCDGIADVPVEKGGAGKGFGPHELLEAAFATCLSITVQKYALKHGIPLQTVHCEVRMDRSVSNLVTLDYSLTFEGKLSDEQEAQLRTEASHCPVARTLSGTIAINPITRPDIRFQGVR